MNIYLNAIMDDNKGLIIALAMATFLYFAINTALAIYLWKFKKREFREVYFNKRMLIILFIILNISLPILIYAYIYGLTVVDSTTTIMIVLIVLNFIFPILVGIYIFFFLQYLTIGVDDKEIAFLGERILISKIVRVERNDKTNQIIIHYTEGSRSKKKCRFSLSSQAGQFMLHNVALLNQELVSAVPTEPSTPVTE